MQKRTFLAILMAAILLVTAGCSLIVKDEEIDKQTVIVTVAGKTLLKGELMNDYNAQVAIQESYGYDMSVKENKERLQDSLIDIFVQNAVLDQKSVENGVEPLDEETLTQVKTTAKEEYDSYSDYLKAIYFADTELEGDALKAAIDEMMVAQGVGTLEQLEKQAIRSKQYELLKEKFTEGVTVTDDEIQFEYDSRVSAAKEKYETTLTQYEADTRSGATIYYHPAGYRYIKNLLIKISEEDASAINDINTQINTKQTELGAAISIVTDYEDDTEENIAALDEEAKAARETNYKQASETKEKLDKELADLYAQLTEKQTAAFLAIKPTVDEINEKLAAGEDFDALLEEYGQDDGMKQSPAKETGYLLCEGLTRYVESFTQGGMALKLVGDVSEPIESTYGYHILKYASDLKEGAVPLDELKDMIKEDVLKNNKTTEFNSIFTQWITDANAKIDREALK